MHVLHLSSWKDSLNDKRYGDYENPILQYMYSATGLESRKLFSFAKTIHLMCISILPSLDAVPYI